MKKLYILSITLFVFCSSCTFYAGQKVLTPQLGPKYKALYPEIAKDSVSLSWVTKPNNKRNTYLYDVKIWEVENDTFILDRYQVKLNRNIQTKYYQGMRTDKKSVKHSIMIPFGYCLYVKRWPSSWGKEVYSAINIDGAAHIPNYKFVPGKVYVWAVQRKQSDKIFGWSSMTFERFYFAFDLALGQIPYGFVIKK